MAPLRLRAFAKLNLALAVGPPEHAGPKIGWHPICSWMHAIDLHDDVTVEADRSLKGPTLDARWADDAPVHPGEPLAWPIENDLAYRAALLLDKSAPLRITIRKRIPDGGGLGGGSSDAAAVLRAGAALLGLNLGPAKLREMAMTLGSDIAFFIGDADSSLDAPPRPAIVSGFGQAIERLAAPAPPVEVTLAIPPFPCATAEVYKAFDALEPGPLREMDVRSLAKQPPHITGLFNALAPAADSMRPELSTLRDTLRANWRALVHVTGSGSTLFSIGRHTGLDGTHNCVLVHARLV